MPSKTRKKAQKKSRSRKKARSEIANQRERLKEEQGEEFTSLPEKEQEAMARKAYLEKGGVEARDGIRALLQEERSNLQDEAEELRMSFLRLKAGKTNAEDADVLSGVDIKSIIRSDQTVEEKMEEIWEAFENLDDKKRKAAIQTVRGRQDVLAAKISSNTVGSDINTVSAMIKGWLNGDPESYFDNTLEEIDEDDMRDRHASVLGEELLQKIYENLDNPEELFEGKVEEMEELNEVIEDLLYGRNVEGVNGFGDAIDFQEELKETIRDQRAGVEQ